MFSTPWHVGIEGGWMAILLRYGDSAMRQFLFPLFVCSRCFLSLFVLFCSLFPCSLYLSCPKRGNRSGLVLVCAAANLHAKELSMSIGRFVQPSVPRAFRFALYYSFLCSSSSASSSLFPWFVFNTVTHHWDELNNIFCVLFKICDDV